MNIFKYNNWAIIIHNNELNSKQIEIVKMLKTNEYDVVIIGSNDFYIDDVKVYETLKDVPHNIDVVAIVENSIDNYAVLDEIELLDIKNICFTKDSYTEHLIKNAKELKLNISYNLDSYQKSTN